MINVKSEYQLRWVPPETPVMEHDHVSFEQVRWLHDHSSAASRRSISDVLRSPNPKAPQHTSTETKLGSAQEHVTSDSDAIRRLQTLPPTTWFHGQILHEPLVLVRLSPALHPERRHYKVTSSPHGAASCPSRMKLSTSERGNGRALCATCMSLGWVYFLLSE